MKPAILLSVFAVTALAIACAEEEAQLSDTDRSYGLTDTGKATVAAILIGVGFVALGGTALLQGNGNRRKHSHHLGSNYQKDVLNFPDNNQVLKGVSNLFFEHDQQVDARPVREKRDAPISSFRRGRRTPRGGNRLLSLYLKPPGSSIDNLKKAWGVYKPKGRVQGSEASKGKRLLSVSLRKPNPNKPKAKVPNNIYTRAFQRFSEDVQRNGHRVVHRARSNQRIARPRPRAVQGRPRYRSRRAPVRRPVRSYRKRVGRTNKHGKEIFSLFLKKPVASRRVPLGGRYAPAKADLPLICKFQPKKCGAKGKKLFSIYYRGFKNVFPNAFPIV
jgi:hypothetical protein